VPPPTSVPLACTGLSGGSTTKTKVGVPAPLGGSQIIAQLALHLNKSGSAFEPDLATGNFAAGRNPTSSTVAIEPRPPPPHPRDGPLCLLLAVVGQECLHARWRPHHLPPNLKASCHR
jgi:hypothetical protein